MDFEKLLKCELYLLDMDGTLYLGDEVFNGAVNFINTLSATGRRYIYLTNNSSRAGVDYVTRLKRLGFPARWRTCLLPVWRQAYTCAITLQEKPSIRWGPGLS